MVQKKASSRSTEIEIVNELGVANYDNIDKVIYLRVNGYVGGYIVKG